MPRARKPKSSAPQKPKIERVINKGSVQSLVQLVDKRHVFVETKTIPKQLMKEYRENYGN